MVGIEVKIRTYCVPKSIKAPVQGLSRGLQFSDARRRGEGLQTQPEQPGKGGKYTKQYSHLISQEGVSPSGVCHEQEPFSAAWESGRAARSGCNQPWEMALEYGF